jgi:hypothetical protein
MGRTIPNMLALPFGEISISYESYVTLNAWPAVNIALSLLLGRGSGAGRASAIPASWAVALLTFAAVVIRIEIAGLLGLFAIQLLLDSTLSITRLVKVGLISGLVSIGMRFNLRQFMLHRCTRAL